MNMRKKTSHKVLWKRSSRYRLTLIVFFVDIALAILKHFLSGLSVEIVATANGLIASYVIGKSIRYGKYSDPGGVEYGDR